MSENITIITDDSFTDEVLNSDIPVLVDFWAEWCGPCKMLAPTLENVAADFVGKVKIAKVNVDENSRIASEHNIRGIPTLIMFKGGQVVATKTGALTKSQLTDLINDHL